MNDETQTETTQEAAGTENTGSSEATGSEESGAGVRPEELPTQESGGTEAESGSGSEEASKQGQGGETGQDPEESGTETEENGSITEGTQEDCEDPRQERVALPDGVALCKTKEGVSLRVSQKYSGGWVALSPKQWESFFNEVESKFCDN